VMMHAFASQTAACFHISHLSLLIWGDHGKRSYFNLAVEHRSQWLLWKPPQ
jgi:hypothetical protein